MSEPHPFELSGDQRAELEVLVARIEEAWFRGANPAIEEFLPENAELRRAVLAELIHAEMELRRKAGQPALLEAYLVRFPELAADERLIQSLEKAFPNPGPNPNPEERRTPMVLPESWVSAL